MPQYKPYQKDILGVWQGDKLLRGFQFPDNYEFTQEDEFVMHVRKTYGNKSILLEFKMEDDSLTIDFDEKVLWITMEGEDMQVETGMHVYSCKNITQDHTVRIGKFEIKDTATRDYA